MAAQATLYLGCADLFFASRIETTAKQLGYRIERLPGGPTELTLSPSSIAILDLDGAGDPFAWIRSLRALDHDLPVFVFVRHDESEKIRQAKEAGASRVFSRGAFSQKLPDLLNRELGSRMG